MKIKKIIIDLITSTMEIDIKNIGVKKFPYDGESHHDIFDNKDKPLIEFQVYEEEDNINCQYRPIRYDTNGFIDGNDNWIGLPKEKILLVS